MRQAQQIIRLIGDPPQCGPFGQQEPRQGQERKGGILESERRHLEIHPHRRHRRPFARGRSRGRRHGLSHRAGRRFARRQRFAPPSFRREPLHGFPPAGLLFFAPLFLAHQAPLEALEVQPQVRRRVVDHPPQRREPDPQRLRHGNQIILQPAINRLAGLKGRLHDVHGPVGAGLRPDPSGLEGIEARGKSLQPALQSGANGFPPMRGYCRFPVAIPFHFPRQLIRGRAAHPAGGGALPGLRRAPGKFREAVHLVKRHAQVVHRGNPGHRLG